VDVSLARRILWSMVSKAAERSRRTRAESFCSSIARRRSFWMRSRAVSVEWNFLYADWKGQMDGKDCRWSFSRLWIMRSRILETKLRFEIGR